jgi:nucleotide-binding universal stress UspA family protein
VTVERREMNGSIVCGVDGSLDSRRALDVAAQYARQLGSRLIVVNVVPVRDPVVPSPWHRYATMGRPATLTPRMPDASTQAEMGASQALLEELVAGVEVRAVAECRTMVGIPAEQLTELADDVGAELIVVGSRGRGAFRAAFLGSVSNSLVGIARCPVLVVPRGVVETAAAA